MYGDISNNIVVSVIPGRGIQCQFTLVDTDIAYIGVYLHRLAFGGEGAILTCVAETISRWCVAFQILIPMLSEGSGNKTSNPPLSGTKVP